MSPNERLFVAVIADFVDKTGQFRPRRAIGRRF